MWGEHSVDMASPVSPFILIAVHNQRLDMTRSHLYIYRWHDVSTPDSGNVSKYCALFDIGQENCRKGNSEKSQVAGNDTCRMLSPAVARGQRCQNAIIEIRFDLNLHKLHKA